MKKTLAFLTFALVALVLNGKIWAMGEEDFGNTALNAANFGDWPGIMPLVNHPSRVYHTWVNGNEHFYYEGNTAALNDALRKFSASKAEFHEVLLRPGPCIAETFDRTKTIPYNWNLHIVGGIARHMTTLELGSKVWSKTPTMTICVGKDIDLEKIEIPKDVSIVEIADLSRRYREAFASKDQTVRGWATGELAHLDPYDAENMTAIAKLLNDKVDWVRLNAAGSLAVFGKKAESVLPTLRETLGTQDKQLKATVERTIKEIQQAKDNAAAEEEHRTILKKIREFLDSGKSKNKNVAERSNKTAVEFSEKIKSVLPSGWSVKSDKNIVTVRRDKPIEWYGTISLPPLGLADLKAQGFVHSGNYTIVLEFFPPMSKADIDELIEDNRSIEEHYDHQHPQPKDSKPLGTSKELLDSLHHIPNVLGKKCSVRLTPFIQGPGEAFFNEQDKKECEGVERDVRRLLKSDSEARSG